MVASPKGSARALACAGVAASALAFACTPAPPTPTLAAAPASGRAPLPVTLDASGSQGEAPLRYRFDVDGDGAWDTAWQSEATTAHVYDTPGAFAARVEVMDALEQSTVAVLAPAIEVEAALANLTVDANRDGVLTGADEIDAARWSATRGALFFANFDDDDGDTRRDFRDDVVNGDADAADLAPLRLRHAPGLRDGDLVTLRVTPASAAQRVRIFEPSGSQWVLRHALGAGEVRIDPLRLAAGDVELLLEGAGSRDGDWDGRVVLRLEVEREGSVLESDAAELRVAPILFPDNTRPAEQLYVMRIGIDAYGSNLPFYNALQAGLPEGVSLYTVNEVEYDGDRWVQDSMQTGYQAMPRAGEEERMLTYLETERMSGGGLAYLLPYELMSADFGFAYPGGQETSLNYGGNLEVAPPHRARGVDYPFGRIMIGGGAQGLLTGRAYEDHMTPEQWAFLDAQELQGTVVEFSTEWLAVGHIDEYFLFIPDASRPERPWRIALASPTLARAALAELREAGQGGLLVFAGRETQTSVNRILDDEELMAFNDAAQARIDSMRERLVETMELTDEDFIELPVLYEVVPYGGLDFAAALNPGVQNLVVTNRTLFIPDPEGPQQRGVDVWRTQIERALATTGNELIFVDVFDSYHLLLGEAHCGTNVRHAAFEARWWQP